VPNFIDIRQGALKQAYRPTGTNELLVLIWILIFSVRGEKNFIHLNIFCREDLEPHMDFANSVCCEAGCIDLGAGDT
jgi:hypothetical protein